MPYLMVGVGGVGLLTTLGLMLTAAVRSSIAYREKQIGQELLDHAEEDAPLMEVMRNFSAENFQTLNLSDPDAQYQDLTKGNCIID